MTYARQLAIASIRRLAAETRLPAVKRSLERAAALLARDTR